MNLPLIFSKIGFWGRRHSPELLIAGGILSAAASVAAGIYATTKLEKVIKPYNEKIDQIKKDLKDDNKIQNKEIDIKQCRKELTTTYLKAGLKIAALYAPSALFFGSSVCCILGSHRIMHGRNVALAATCTTLEQSYRAYRQRVKDKYGEEAEDQLFNDIHKEKVEVIDPVTGKVKNKTLDIPHADNEDWKVFFQEGCNQFENDAALNFDSLMLRQAYFNELLHRRGYLFLWDVYKDLGFTTAMLGEKRARASRILGWIYNPEDKSRNCYISFGLTQPNTTIPLPRVAAQIEANEPRFLLTLNPDGDILSGEYGKETFMKYATELA